MEYVYTQTVKT